MPSVVVTVKADPEIDGAVCWWCRSPFGTRSARRTATVLQTVTDERRDVKLCRSCAAKIGYRKSERFTRSAWRLVTLGPNRRRVEDINLTRAT